MREHARSVHGLGPSAPRSRGAAACAAVAALTAAAWGTNALMVLFVSLFCGDARQGAEATRCMTDAVSPLALTVLPVIATAIAASRKQLGLALVFAAATAVGIWLHWSSL